MPELSDYIDQTTLRELIQTARLEDLGPDGVDVTSACFIDAEATGDAWFYARDFSGIVAGIATLPMICEVYGGRTTLEVHANEGDEVNPHDPIARITGPLRDLLAIERVALNLLTHLSGIAYLTREYVKRCEGTGAKVYDTRKTLPGLRGLQKYAVACGGGHTHRVGLYDAVLIKDNHLAGTPLDRLAEKLTEAAGQARRLNPGLKFVEVEVDTLEQLAQVLKAPVDIVLLDNMKPGTLTQAVAMRDAAAPDIQLEASGGVALDTVHAIAQTGVQRISVGALTHSATAVDIGLDFR